MSPADGIALEDSHNGLRSALAAGIKTYITTNPYTRKQDFTGAAAVFDDLSDLPFLPNHRFAQNDLLGKFVCYSIAARFL